MKKPQPLNFIGLTATELKQLAHFVDLVASDTRPNLRTMVDAMKFSLRLKQTIKSAKTAGR